MRRTLLAMTALWCGLMPLHSASAQEEGRPGDLPGAQVQRRLGGPGTGYVCTATNAMHTQQCTTSCPSRETADCEDAEGGGTPSCQCTKE